MCDAKLVYVKLDNSTITFVRFDDEVVITQLETNDSVHLSWDEWGKLIDALNTEIRENPGA